MNKKQLEAILRQLQLDLYSIEIAMASVTSGDKKRSAWCKRQRETLQAQMTIVDSMPAYEKGV